MISSIVAPAATFSDTADTGIRLFLNTNGH